MEPLASGTECYFTSLPMELHLRIRNELLKDPDGEYNYFKSLRLVCKLFDLVWSPVVLVNLLLFPNNPICNFDPEYLGRLVDGKSNLHTFNTVTLQNWEFINTRFYRFLDHLMDFWIVDWRVVLLRVLPLRILAIPVQIFGEPTRHVRRLKRFSTLLRVRRYARAFPHKLKLPNVSCVRLIFDLDCGIRWEIYWMTKFLTMIPNLTELVLYLPYDADMAYISMRLNPLRTLRKFTLQTYSYHILYPPHPRHQISFFSSVIARNPNLTHLGLMLQCSRCDFSEMLGDIPDNKPLRLECVTIDCFFNKADALLPHIQSLSSLETRLNDLENDTTLYSMLGRSLVFPPAISVDSLENGICMYLDRHPGVTNFSINRKGCLGSSHQDYGLSKVIMRHSGTLRKLRTRSHMLLTLDAEVALLKCVQLSELVLIFTDGATIINDEYVLGIAARLSRSLTVVIEDRTVFWACVKYCRNSENPLLHDLAGRVMYEEPDEIPSLVV